MPLCCSSVCLCHWEVIWAKLEQASDITVRSDRTQCWSQQKNISHHKVARDSYDEEASSFSTRPTLGYELVYGSEKIEVVKNTSLRFELEQPSREKGLLWLKWLLLFEAPPLDQLGGKVEFGFMLRHFQEGNCFLQPCRSPTS